MTDSRLQSRTEILLLVVEDWVIILGLSAVITAIVFGLAALLGIPLVEMMQNAG